LSKIKKMAVDSSKQPPEKFYDGLIDLNVKNNSHTMAFNFIKNLSQGRKAKILEVGCASGYFGAVLKNEGHELWGIEISPEAAVQASTRLDHVYVGTIEDFLKEHDGQNIGFDYIIFGDVLEHLTDPTKVLRKCHSLLKYDGRVIASIPNVAHLAVRLMLLDGRWKYSKLGIMDDTHLRFFTKSSILEMFSDAKFAIEAMDCVRLPVELVSDQIGISVNNELMAAVTPLLRDNEQDVFQYLVLSSVANNDKPILKNNRFHPKDTIRILCLLPVVGWSLSDIRIQNPLEEWARRYGGIVRIKSVFGYQDDDLNWASVVIFQREANEQIIHLIEDLQRRDKRVVFEIDDLLTELPPFLSVYNDHLATKPYLEKALHIVNTVTVTTLRLREKLSNYNDHVLVVPNCASSIGPPVKHYDSNIDQVTLILASSDSVRVDFIVPSLEDMVNDPKLNIRIIGIGPPGQFLKKTGLPVENLPNMQYDEFKSFLMSCSNAIGIIPLDDSNFSACKSAIKYIDYSLAGIPSVCSAVPPYSDVVRNEVTGLLVPNKKDAWYSALKHLALSPDERQQLATNARQFCTQSFSMQVAADAWQQVFIQLHPVRSHTIEAGSAQPFQSYSRHSFWRRALHLASYVNAFRVLRQEGFRGIQKRLKLLS